MTPAVPQIFARTRRAQRQRRAARRQLRAGAATWLGDAMVEDALERLDFMRLAHGRALVTGLHRALLARGLKERGWQVDAVEYVDFEQPLVGGRYDLIASLGELDTVNDLPGALLHLRAGLSDGGLLLASMVGAGSLPRLRQAMLAADGARPAARVHPMVDSRAASALLQRAGFARQVVDSYPLVVRYAELTALVRDLRDQALGSALRDRAPPLDREALRRARHAFGGQADEDGRVSERFEVLTLTAWRS